MVVKFMAGHDPVDFNSPWTWQTVVRKPTVIKNSEIWPNIEMTAWWILDLLCQCLQTSPADYRSVGLTKKDFKPSASSPLASSIPIWYAWVSVFPGKDRTNRGGHEGVSEGLRDQAGQLERRKGNGTWRKHGCYSQVANMSTCSGLCTCNCRRCVSESNFF